MLRSPPFISWRSRSIHFPADRQEIKDAFHTRQYLSSLTTLQSGTDPNHQIHLILCLLKTIHHFYLEAQALVIESVHYSKNIKLHKLSGAFCYKYWADTLSGLKSEILSPVQFFYFWPSSSQVWPGGSSLLYYALQLQHCRIPDAVYWSLDTLLMTQLSRVSVSSLRYSVN